MNAVEQQDSSLEQTILTGEAKSNHSSPKKLLVSRTSSLEISNTCEALAKFLFQDSISTLKVNESQKSVMLDIPEADSVLKFLEKEDLTFKYCRLCDVICEESHFSIKTHIKKRDEFSLKESEDFSLSMLVFASVPGEIEAELQKEKEKALKRKVKRIK